MTELSPELQGELVEFVREVTDLYRRPGGWPKATRDAIKLIAKLPPPVDPDLEEARGLMVEYPLLSELGGKPLLELVHRAIKLGRELERSGK